MKKHIYRLVASLLIATTLITATACSNTSNKGDTSGTETSVGSNVSMGRYMERMIDLPENLHNVWGFKVEEGKVVIYANNTARQAVTYTYGDGKWEETACEWLEKMMEKNQQVTKIETAEDGSVYVLYYTPEASMAVAKVEEDGTLKEVPLKEIEQVQQIMDMKVVGDNQVMISIYNHGIVRLDATTGEVVQEYLSAGITGNFVLTEGEVVVIDGMQGNVHVFDYETGNEKYSVPYEGNIWSSELAIDALENVYLVNQDGINRLVKGGGIWEQVVEGSMSTFGDPSNYIMGFDVLAEEHFVSLFTSMEEGYSLVEYYYDESVPSRPTTELTLYMLEENRTIKQAIASYRRRNPDVLINVQVGREQGETITLSDAIRSLNTQLLAGKGPDILLLDGLPMASYIEKGVLLDLSEWAGPLVKDGTWVDGVVANYRREDGKIYGLPSRFSVIAALGEKELLEEVDDLEGLLEWSQQHPDIPMFYQTQPDVLMELLLPVTAQFFLDEDGKLQEDAYASFLTFIKANSNLNAQVYDMEIERDGRAMEYFAHEEIQLHLTELTSFMHLDLIQSALGMREDSKLDFALDKNGGTFIGKGIMGINANSKHIDIAKEIVALALSEEVQKVDLQDGFSINKSVLDQQATLDPNNMIAMMMATFEKPIDYRSAQQEDHYALRDLVVKASNPAFQDELLTNLLIDEAKGYFSGDKTAAEVSSATAKRTKAYLAE